MRIAILSFALVLLAGCGKAPDSATPDASSAPLAAAPEAAPAPASVTEKAAVAALPADDRVTAFIAAYQAQMFRGLPNAEQAAALAEHFSPRLNGLLRDALAGQQDYKAKYPTDKPPMIDGDIFSSLFEGATSGTVASVEESGNTATAQVAWVYSDPDSGKVIQSWADRFLLVREGEGWLIDDVEYLGGWDFSPKGRLSAGLAETAALRE